MKLNELNLDGYKFIKSNDWNLPENLSNWLIDNGFKCVGSGNFSSVFLSNEKQTFVVKVNRGSNMDENYLKFIDFCHKNKGNKHLPKMGELKKYDDWYFIFIERLEPVNFGNRAVAGYLSMILKMIIFDDSLSVNISYNDFENFAIDIFSNFDDSMFPQVFKTDKGKQQLIEMFYVLYMFKTEYNISKDDFDFYDRNIMRRGDTFVITDPVM